MKREYVIYLLLVLAAAASVLLLASVYLFKCQFVIGEAVPKQAERTSYKDGKMIVETDINGLNNRIANFMEEYEGLSLPEGLSINEMACILKAQPHTGANELYISFTDSFNIPYSFKCGLELLLEDGTANVSVSDIRLGTYELPYVGGFLWRLFNIPENISFSLKRADELRYLTAIDINEDGAITLTYDYDAEALSKVFTEILGCADERKIEYHRSKEAVDEGLIRLAEEKSASPADALLLVNGFEKEPDSFLSLCYLLNEEGIRKLYLSFGEEYYRFVGADELIEASENEIDSGLNEFHKKFSRLLLQYLYRNPDYTADNGSLYLHGNKITPETILAGTGNVLYDVDIWADKSNITAKYSYSGYEAERVIVKENGK